MGVYIKGMEIPNCSLPVKLQIWPDGQVEVFQSGEYWSVTKALHVPQHSRLIDADTLKSMFSEPNVANGGWRNPDEALVHKTGIWAAIDAAPTVIEAEEVLGGLK